MITYPARPKQGGDFPTALSAGCYPDLEQWRVTPKLNGWRALVHVPSRTMFNRHGSRLSIQSEFNPALDQLQFSPFEWLDCEALERRHGIGKGTLVVLDCVTVEHTFDERMTMLREFFPIMPPPLGVLPEFVYAGDSFMAGRDTALGTWDKFIALNEAARAVFYEGFVMKDAASLYPIQLRSPEEQFGKWVKHRFTTK